MNSPFPRALLPPLIQLNQQNVLGVDHYRGGTKQNRLRQIQVELYSRSVYRNTRGREIGREKINRGFSYRLLELLNALKSASMLQQE